MESSWNHQVVVEGLMRDGWCDGLFNHELEDWNEVEEEKSVPDYVRENQGHTAEQTPPGDDRDIWKSLEQGGINEVGGEANENLG